MKKNMIMKAFKVEENGFMEPYTMLIVDACCSYGTLSKKMIQEFGRESGHDIQAAWIIHLIENKVNVSKF